MLSMTDRVEPSADVVDTELADAELALLHLKTKAYFSLNLTGARIWKGIKARRTLGEICGSLRDEFEIGAEQAERSVSTLVADLLAKELVTLAHDDV